MPGRTLPDDGHGRCVAFAIARDALSQWEERLRRHRRPRLRSRADWWRRPEHSIYFRDPDGHLVELATPGLWAIY